MIAAALLALGLAAPEAARAATQQEDAQRYYYEEIFEPFFVKDAKAGVYRSRRRGALPTTFPIRKSTDTFRVFLLGGSIARMALVDRPTRDLAEALQAALPGRRVEAVNCGMAGYDSYREALVLQEVLEYKPDLVVLFTGHNESLGSPPVPVWILKTQERLQRWNAFRALAARLRADPWKLPPDPEEAAARRDAAFEKNLRESARQARARGAAAVALIPPINYRDSPTSQEAPALSSGFLRGRLAALRGDCGVALERWDRALEEMPARTSQESNRSLVQFHAARCEERLGRVAAAAARYEAAARDDRRRCGPGCHELIRRAAAAEGAALAEADARFREAASPRAPGLDLFDDGMHWKPRWNSLVSLSVAEAARAHPALAALPWDDAGLRALCAAWQAPPADPEADGQVALQYALREAAMTRGRTFSRRVVAALERLRESRPDWFASPEELLSRASLKPGQQVWGLPEVAPSRAVLEWHLAEAALLRGDRNAAGRLLGSALAGQPSLAGAWLSQALLHGLQGDPAAALESARSAVRAEPEDREKLAAAREAAALAEAAGWGAPWGDGAFDDLLPASEPPPVVPAAPKPWQAAREEALELQAAGKADRAWALLDGLVKRHPEEAVLLKDRGVCEYRLGRHDAAVASLTGAVKREPRLLSASLSLGTVHAERGRWREALAVYDAALAVRVTDRDEDAGLRPALLEARRDAERRVPPKARR